jgi:hypothetical protein
LLEVASNPFLDRTGAKEEWHAAQIDLKQAINAVLDVG